MSDKVSYVSSRIIDHVEKLSDHTKATACTPQSKEKIVVLCVFDNSLGWVENIGGVLVNPGYRPICQDNLVQEELYT